MVPTEGEEEARHEPWTETVRVAWPAPSALSLVVGGSLCLY